MATDYLVNLKDSNVMQMVYEQDVDLGFDWQHLNEANKPLKDLSKNQTDKNMIRGYDLCIDGETGEQVPAAVKNESLPLSSLRPTTLASTQRFNFHGNFDPHQSPINTHQSLKAVNQTSGVWQQSHEYPQLPTIGSQSGRNSQLNGTQSSSLTNLNQSCAPRQLATSCASMDNLNMNQMNSFNNNFQTDSLSTVGYPISYNREPQVPYTSPHYSPETFSPHVPTPSNMLPIGSPMERESCSTVVSPQNPEPRFPFDRFNNYKYEDVSTPSISSGDRNASTTSLPEPGQSFFELGPRPDVPYYLTDLGSGSTSGSSFPQNMSGAFLNPSVSNYPPPLHSSPPYAGLYMGKSTDSHMIKSSTSDLSEADSGVFMDRSPKNFSYLNTISSEEYVVKSRDLSSSRLHDVKTYPFNNFTSNYEQTRKLTKKKSNQSTHCRESRDEKRARELNLPFTLDEIILTPVEDYNEMLARTHLNAAQQALIKDIRRRGKNKVAAQNCRKRKIETITNMEEDVDLLRNRKQHLVEEQKQIEIRQHNIRIQYNSLYQQVFNSLRDETGHSYDLSQFNLDQVRSPAVLMSHGHHSPDQHMVEGRGIPMDYKVKMEHQI